MNRHDDFSDKKKIFLIGPSGSGKTVVGKAIEEVYGWPFLDTDSLIENHEKMLISDIFSKRGEQYFRNLEISIIDNDILQLSMGVVATGGGLPTINGMMKRLSDIGETVYLKATIEELWNRLSVDPKELEVRPLLYKGGRAALEKMVRARDHIYLQAKHIVETDGLQIPDIVEEVHKIHTKS